MNSPQLSVAELELNIDLSIALRKLHQLQLEDGDLGAEYWYQVGRLLKATGDYRARALAAEEELRQR